MFRNIGYAIKLQTMYQRNGGLTSRDHWYAFFAGSSYWACAGEHDYD